MQGTLYSSEDGNDYPNAKTQYSEITTTVRNSVSHLQHPILSIPRGRGNPADFIFPPSTSAWELSTFSFLLPKPIALHKQAAAILPAQTFVFSPLFFFCTMSHGTKVITDQDKGRVYCLHLSFIQVYTQPSKKRKAGDYHAGTSLRC